ncbi:MAG: aromatic ring-hydroxylating dioxygenase subunit alpha [Chloroflexota bacterium]
MKSNDPTDLVQVPELDGSIYLDPEIFDLEMQRIFERTWLYAAHVSELPNVGDFKTFDVGREPIILVRGEDGKLSAYLNRCRHRAATVCQDECGNARRFQCVYHGWIYRTDGTLVSITDADGYPADIDQSALSLQRVPRVGTVHGFVFVSLAEEGPTLEEHLGGVAAYLKYFNDLAPDGTIRVFEGVQKTAYDGNWKLAMENGTDSYHPAYLHRTVLPPDFKGSYHGEDSLGRVGGVDGHGILDMRDYPPIVPGGPPESAMYLSVFPNLVVLRSQIRQIIPVSVDRTVICTWAVWLDGLDEEQNVQRLRIHENAFGAAGLVAADDYEAFHRITDGLRAQSAPTLLISRGAHREVDDDGGRWASITDETPTRALYESWSRWMGR